MTVRNATITLKGLLLVALTAGPAGAALTGPSALVIHGNDRSLAAVAAPSGPAQLNLAALDAFPNDLVVRGGRGYAVCSGAGTLLVIDLGTGAIVNSIDCGAGTNPWGLVFTSDTRAYVSRLYSNDVLALDLPAGTVAATIPVGTGPEGMTVAAGRVFVANSGFSFVTYTYQPGTVSVIDPETNSVTQTLGVGLNPQSLATAPNGEVHALCSGNYFSVFGRAFVIDPLVPAVVDSLDLGASPGVLAIDDAGAAYASDYFAGVLKYDTATRQLLRDANDPIPVGVGAAGIAFGGGLTWVCVYGDDRLVTLDAADNVVDTFNVGDGPQDVAFHTPEPPIAVTLAAFTGAAGPEGVELTWRTATEAEHAGFHVERAAAADGPWRRLTDRLLPPAGAGRYSWTDAEAAAAAEASDTATLWYRLSAVDRAGRIEFFAPLAVRIDRPAGLSFLPPMPNPVRGAGTVLSFRLARAGAVRLSVFDAAGREVARPADGVLAAGEHSVFWNGADGAGRRLAAGTYFVQIYGSGGKNVHRITLTR